MDARNPLVHEASAQRQHPRVNLPIWARVDGAVYTVANWSVGGICIHFDEPKPSSSDEFEAELIFPTDGVDLVARVRCEVIHNDGKNGGTGCRFLDLSRSNLSLLQYMVGAYVSGELIRHGDALSVLKRDNFVSKRPAKSAPPRFKGIAQSIRRVSKLVVLAMLGLALILYVSAAIYKRIYIVEMEGYVGSPAAAYLRTPTDGVLVELGLERGRPVTRGQVLGRIEDPEGNSKQIVSPCSCMAVTTTTPIGAVLERGAPIAVLAPEGAELSVVAQISIELSPDIGVGDSAQLVMFNGRAEMAGTVTSLQRFTPIAYSSERGTASLKSYVIVTIRPEGSLTLSEYAEPVRISIDTLRNGLR